MHSKRVCRQGGKHAEQRAVREPREPGDEEEPVRTGDEERGGLGGGEEEGGGDEAPEAGCAQTGEEEVRADAGEEAAGEGGEAEDGDVRLLAGLEEGVGGVGVVGEPEGCGVVADVAGEERAG